VALTVPLAYGWVMIISNVRAVNRFEALSTADLVSEQLWPAWRGFFILALLSIWLRAHWRARRRSLPPDSPN